MPDLEAIQPSLEPDRVARALHRVPHATATFERLAGISFNTHERQQIADVTRNLAYDASDGMATVTPIDAAFHAATLVPLRRTLREPTA